VNPDDDMEATLDIFTGEELLAEKLSDIRWAVPGVVPAGVTLLVGAPKMGKSWLALELALGIATGRPVLGDIEVEQGGVLYLALEDNRRRLQTRLRKLGGENDA
jgi:RecA-family ATPase